MSGTAGPRHVVAEVVAVRKVGAHRQVTLTARGVPELFRPGNFVQVGVGERTTGRSFWVHRVRQTSALGPTIDLLVEPAGWGSEWLAAQPVGTRLPLTGPLGRPFALPKEPVACLLVGHGYAAGALFALAERLRERGCGVNLLLAAPDEAHLVSAHEARRWARSVTVVTADGSVGQSGEVADHLDQAFTRTGADVAYGCGPTGVVRAVAEVAQAHGAWSQVALEVPAPCGTGLCHGCPLPVVGEDGVARVLRACTEGPVVRGDRVKFEELGVVR